MGICPVITSPGKIRLVKMSSWINKHACVLHGVTKVLKGSLLFLVCRVLKLALKIFLPYRVFGQMLSHSWISLVIRIKPISLYFLSHVIGKENPTDTCLPVLAKARAASYPQHHHPHEGTKVLNREKPALMVRCKYSNSPPCVALNGCCPSARWRGDLFKGMSDTSKNLTYHFTTT